LIEGSGLFRPAWPAVCPIRAIRNQLLGALLGQAHIVKFLAAAVKLKIAICAIL